MATPSVTCQPTASLALANPLSLASGHAYYPIATGLSGPRALAVDDANNLLVLDRGRGVVALSENATDCQGWQQRLVVADGELNHGLAVRGSTLYASTADALYRYSWDARTFAVGARETLVTGMAGGSHNTRTIVLEPSTAAPAYAIMGRGSDGNLDLETAAANRSQVRRFPLNGSAPIDWTAGDLVAEGVRNAVGMAITPDLRHLVIVENSGDNLRTTGGVDVSNSNPSEDVNYVDLGAPARDYGYPDCFTIFDPAVFPTATTTGAQFSVNPGVSDAQCNADSTPPRLSLPAHYAPLDVVFLASDLGNSSFRGDWAGSALVASHGSWDADPPVGYALLRVPMDTSTYEPIAAADSQTGFDTLLAPPDLSACPGRCFRPVGVAIERSRARDNGAFISSDSTGEIIRMYRGAALRSDGTSMRRSLAIVAAPLLAALAALTL